MEGRSIRIARWHRFLLVWSLLHVALPVAYGYMSQQEAFVQTFDLVWSTVHESHWDENFGGKDWSAVGEKYRPLLKKVDSRAELVLVLQGMLDELELSHYKILSSFAGPEDKYPRGGYVGLELKYLDGRAYVVRVAPGSPAEAAGVKVGWRLKSIHRRSVKGLTASILRSRLPDNLKEFHIQRYLNDVIQGGTIKRIRSDWYPPGKRALKVYMNPIADTRELSDPVGYLPAHRIEFEQSYLTGNILYLRFNAFVPNLMADLRDSLEEAAGNADGVIIDIRSNVGGLSILATGITGLLVDEPTNLGKLFLRKGYLTYQGFPQRKRFSGPIAILIDGKSASTSEMLAAGLQETGRARVFGEISLGQSLPSLFKKLPTGDVFQYAVGDYLTPGGYRIEKNGVVPDEVLIPSFDQLEQGIDLPLERARNWIVNSSSEGIDEG